MTTIQEAAEAHAENETQWCRCSGFTCSGCEAKTIKTATKDFLAGASHQAGVDRAELSANRLKIQLIEDRNRELEETLAESVNHQAGEIERLKKVLYEYRARYGKMDELDFEDGTQERLKKLEAENRELIDALMAMKEWEKYILGWNPVSPALRKLNDCLSRLDVKKGGGV